MKRMVAICLFFLLACEAVFEDDLSNKKVVLVSPTSGVQLNKDSINFKWDPVESADTYTLQIVTPSFEKAKQILLDTVSSKTLYYKKNIPQGEYQWRVKAQNSEYETNFSVGSFKIYIENLSNRQVSLVSPIKNVKLDNNEVTFSWDSLNDAESYNLQIVSPSFKNVTKTILDTLLTKTSFTKKMARGDYEWRVKAKNSNYETKYATGNFEVHAQNLSDRKANLIAPANNVQLDSKKVNFNWDEVKEAESYTLQIATPSFDAVKQVVLDISIENTSHSLELPRGDYQWRVKAKNSDYETKFTTESFKVFIKNLSDREVNLIAPANMAELVEGSIKFDWGEVKDAKNYVLQIVTPSFEKATNLVLDIVLDKTTLTQNLTKGKYEWRVKAMDSKYETKYTINNFEIK